jgi:hypothetical protein
MKIIIQKSDFEDLIQMNDRVIFFVHSPWSGSSKMGLPIFIELAKQVSECKFAIIDNESGEGFIYEWLASQFPEYASHNPEIIIPKGSWIHGHGELIGIRSGKFCLFAKSVFKSQIKDLENALQNQMFNN